MAIRQKRVGTPGSEQHLGVDVGAQAGTGMLWQGEAEALPTEAGTGLAQEGASGSALMEAFDSMNEALDSVKVLKPLPHAVADYAMAGTLMAAPWLFGFSDNKTATANSVASGVAILGLSLMTRYPLGAAKVISFPTHGVIETVAAAFNTAAPWLMGFSRNKSAKWTHVLAGLGTLAVVAMTDYRAAEKQ